MLAYAVPLLIGFAAIAAGFSRPVTLLPDGMLRPWWDALASLLLVLTVHVLQSLAPLHFFALFWLGVAALADARAGLLPERWTRFGIVLIAAGVFIQGDASALGTGLLWGFATSALLYVLRLLGYAMRRVAGVGMGDVKLGLGLGLAFGPWTLLVVYAAFVLSALFILARRLSMPGRRAPRAVPLGPGFLASACLYLMLPAYWLDVAFVVITQSLG